MSEENFEQQLKQLEAAVERLESGELSLEESLTVYESGMQNARKCRDALQMAEQRVELLQEDSAGELVRHPFDAPEEG